MYLPSLNVILLFLCHLSHVTGSGPGTHVMKCYVGNCTTFEECRRPELISDCPNDQLYDACTSIIVQKGKSEDCTYSFWSQPSSSYLCSTTCLFQQYYIQLVHNCQFDNWFKQFMIYYCKCKFFKRFHSIIHSIKTASSTQNNSLFSSFLYA